MKGFVHLLVALAVLTGSVWMDSITRGPEPQAVVTGERVVFECETDSVDPLLGWYKKLPRGADELIFISVNPGDIDSTLYEMEIDTSGALKHYNLVIKQARWQDGSIFVCKLITNNDQASASLIVMDAPDISMPEMHEGEVHNITCDAEYGGPLSKDMDLPSLPHLSTILDGNLITDEYTRIDGSPTETQSLITQTFSYTANRDDDGKNITCMAAINIPDAAFITIKLLRIQVQTARPKFSVRVPNTCQGSGGGWKTLVYEEAMTNQPAGFYNTQTGVFTIPVGGFYHFTADCSSTHSVMIHIQLLVNGNPVVGGRDISEAGHTSLNALLSVQEGDEGRLEWYDETGSGIYGGHCSFTAFLID